MEKILWKENTLPKTDKEESVKFLNKEEVSKAKKFHESFLEYDETPLIDLKELAEKIGLGGIYLKDESYRFGLNAFKVLGGSFAMGKYLAEKLGEDIDDLPYEKMICKEVKDKLGDITFVTATDGNHGRGVAWTANRLKQKSVVFMPKGSSIKRLNNIKAEGAEASITELNYDDAVRLANKYAEEHNGVIIQDTAWKGYEKIPAWIMQGYGTMALEASEQLKALNVLKPTHIFVQAGVGSLAGAVQGFFASQYGDDCPKTVVVESNLADCYYKSAIANDGEARSVGGDMQTIMAGLACGEVNTIGFTILKNYSKAFISCPDWVAAKGMRILGNPLKGDTGVISGESGAVTAGALYEIMTNDEYKDLKEDLELGENSKVLLFSTEGDTDPEKYREIVWDGKY
ncbi:diaminopropionate ammonia-lyase [Clostridium beijerinckii]|jgi:diaminopropionate ammonia-lyase|uniref:Diaminopropionate ammonia-lyase n=2 Tax=Clostridium beijerinckii TaxID=1520 RepID=A0AAE2RVD5_CLOBE|nr:diaminopropionate ammonia-lyase [Clostridium beijerinckii]ABR34147.1 diaminopropionate ammonia-lyase [Clostridium beijerinckii NCIMB 8052]AIU00572.1 diaminopropionate ammonia-lyase [Clostridium beijerinckii ATCC 35702]MBF7811246.1 diaminopropionate ammonia-lyase [Clostridium beijerinckii]NOW91989.1 diaminopropionate ammonia-lyase [Clostridium beijerinckii]NRT24552.1 diaminopropionate ammonia-lyase [Clostridium beijerinckii]